MSSAAKSVYGDLISETLLATGIAPTAQLDIPLEMMGPLKNGDGWWQADDGVWMSGDAR